MAMSSPHLLRPFSGRQLGLVEGDGKVMVFAVLGGRYAGPSMLAHVPTLIRRINELPDEVDVVVFVDEANPVPASVARIDDMLSVFDGVDAMVCYQVAAEAMKVIAGQTVLRGIDRSQLVAVRGPEVILRSRLQKALEQRPPDLWMSPTALVAAAGGRIKLFPEGADQSPTTA